MNRIHRSLALSLAFSLTAMFGSAESRAESQPGAGIGGALAGKPYTLTVAKVAAKKGQPAQATVVFKPAAGYHLNKEFPTGLKLKMPASVTATKAELGRQDAKLSDNEGSFQVTLTSAEAGSKQVTGELRFAVCTETTCDPQKSAVVIEMDVK